MASHLSEEGACQAAGSEQPTVSHTLGPVCSTPCGSLVGICITHRQIAGLPLRRASVAHASLSESVKRGGEEGKTADNDLLLGLKGLELLVLDFLQERKTWKCNLKGKFMIYVLILKPA